MIRFLSAAIVLASAAASFVLPASARASERTLPMHFELRVQGPAQICGKTCKLWISAAGAITADSARDFKQFAQSHDLSGSTMVLDSDGGSVIGAIALGREIRRFALATTVGRTVDLAQSSDQSEPRAELSPRADCESMCAFVLLGGVQRVVPPEARVMVHQIWLGDRREDPTAASYSAEDLVLVQHDIGKLAQYTTEMGASIDLLDLALRIPPWEPMHLMTRDELRGTRLVNAEPGEPVAATVAASPAAAQPASMVTNGVRASKISDRRWAVVDHSGVASLARRHPLTVEGEDIGSFDLVVSCGAGSNSYDLSYIERRHGAEHMRLPEVLSAVTLRVGDSSATLKVASSQRRDDPDELVTYAAGTVPAALIDGFAGAGNRSMVIETESDGMVTAIRLGNTGAPQNMPQLTATCSKPIGARAELLPRKTGGLAAAQ
jgi:hypothetical protein